MKSYRQSTQTGLRAYSSFLCFDKVGSALGREAWKKEQIILFCGFHENHFKLQSFSKKQ